MIGPCNRSRGYVNQINSNQMPRLWTRVFLSWIKINNHEWDVTLTSMSLIFLENSVIELHYEKMANILYKPNRIFNSYRNDP